jgi:RimJ/RimL family protein N-acetyltransferase
VSEGADQAPVIETPRLLLHRLTTGDADFILELLNEPSFLRFIGDKGVRSREDACQYVLNGPVASYARFGFGLYRVGLRETGEAIGICGLLKRDSLEDVDLGFAFLPRFWSKGFAFESAAAVLEHGKATWGLVRVLAVTSPDNEASMRLLARLGFGFERMARLSGDAPEVRLFALEA